MGSLRQKVGRNETAANLLNHAFISQLTGSPLPAAIDQTQDTTFSTLAPTGDVSSLYFNSSEAFLSEDSDLMTLSPTSLIPTTPENDECTNAFGPLHVTPRSLDGSTENITTGTTVGATSESLDRCVGLTITSPSVWYSVVGSGGVLTASTCWPGTDVDTKISIFRNNCTALECVGGNDDASSTVRGTCDIQPLASRVRWTSQMDEMYYILVHAFSTKVGKFEINVEANNDQCQYAIAMGVGDSIRGDTRGAALPFGGQINTCGNVGIIGDGPSVWYSVMVETATRLQATTCQDDSDEDNSKTFGIHVFESTCGTADTCIGGDTPRQGCSIHEWEAEANIVYYVLVHSYTVTSAGNFELSITEIQ